MALDGVYLYSLVHDLKKSIINSKIDKINQPEKDEVILTLRKDRKNIKLLLSASSKFPRIHLTEAVKPNPIKAPMFAMVMRKYLIGGKITNISQIEGDRLIEIHIESTDELGFDSKYLLIIEIMGRHSNITLVRERDNKVMECIKHIYQDVNSFRVLYPGVSYVYPPKSTKLNPYNFTKEDFYQFLNDNSIEFDKSFFSKTFTGIGKSLSESIYKKLLQSNNTINTDFIFDFFENFVLNLNDNFSYRIYKEQSVFKDFHCVPLDFHNYDYIELENPNLLLDNFFSTKDKQDRLLNKSSDLQKLINTNIDRCENKSKKLNITLTECDKKDSYKIKGDLLTSYIYQLKKGQKK